MATRRRPGGRPEGDEADVASLPRGRATIQDRIAAFAMLDGMKDATQAQKTLRLSLVGFTPGEIAGMLQTTTAVVYQNLYEARKKAGVRKARSKSAPADDEPTS